MVGKLLVAHPSILGDHSFGRSVVLMVEHNDEGSLGFIVNQHTHYTLHDLAPELGIDAPVFNGGPVDLDRLFYIHNSAEITNAQAVGNQLFWGGDLDEIKTALHSKKLKSSQIKFLLGYAGWSKNQLNRECKTNTWVLVKNTYNLFTNEEKLWGNIIRDMGGELSFYADAPINPGLN